MHFRDRLVRASCVFLAEKSVVFHIVDHFDEVDANEGICQLEKA